MSTNTASLRKDFDQALGMANGFANSLKSALGAAIPALSVTGLIGAFANIERQALDTSEQLYKMGHITGMSTEALSGLRVLARESGESFESLEGVLARFGKNMEAAFINPASQAGKVLHALFTQAQVDSLKLATPEKMLEEVTKKVFTLGTAQETEYAASVLFGKGWTQNEEALRKFATMGADAAIKKADELNQKYGKESVEAMHRFKEGVQDTWDSVVGYVQQGTYALVANSVTLNRVFDSDWSGGVGYAPKGGTPKKNKSLEDLMGDEKTKGLVERVQGLNDSLQDQLAVLHQGDSALGKLQLEYDKTLREISRMVKEGLPLKDSYQAQASALAVYNEQLSRHAELLQRGGKLPKFPLFGEEFAHALSSASEIDFTKKMIPQVSGLGLSTVQLNLTAQQVSALGTDMDKTRLAEKALKDETELSAGAFKQLADMFPGLTEKEIAADSSAQRLIEHLKRLDATGKDLTFGDAMRSQLDEIKIEGETAGDSLARSLKNALDQTEDEFARLVVTGKGSFKQIAQGVAESFVKAGEQKLVGAVLGHFGIKAPQSGAKAADGALQKVASAADYAARALQHLASSANRGSNGGGSSSPFSMPSGGGDMGGDTGGWDSLFSGGADAGEAADASGSLSDILPMLGAGMAGGGHVSAHSLHMVGERGPELFAPGRSGTIIPNHALGGSINIDARGADAGVEHRVNRAMGLLAVAQRAYGMVSNYDFARRGGSIS